MGVAREVIHVTHLITASLPLVLLNSFHKDRELTISSTELMIVCIHPPKADCMYHHSVPQTTLEEENISGRKF